ncbi:MAG: aminoacyl-tRNA hydrolase [Anaerolineae bacterium]|nr:aminoacyl-tRNA hydrolase [Anaerolineae bacterium]
MDVLEVAPGIAIDPGEIELSFIRAVGPGGQHVNRSATAVQLRFDAAHSPSLPPGVRERLISLAGKQVTKEGVLIIEARRFRSQERNRQDALERLARLIRRAARQPKARRRTRPSRAAKERRLAGKRRRAEIKRWRQSPPGE